MSFSTLHNAISFSILALSLWAPANVQAHAYHKHHRHHHEARHAVDDALTKRSAPAYSGYSLTWVDDFTGTANELPSTSNWLWDLGTSYPGGPSNWGTGEIQTYVKSTANSYLDGNGNLNIVPIKSSGGTWTSARMESTKTFQCAAGQKMRIEASLKLPNTGTATQAGIWPAFWSMGKAFRDNGYTGWPYTGELDILEVVNGAPTAFNTAHCGVYPNGPCNEPNGLGHTSTFTLGVFHTCGLIWDRTASTWQNEFLSWTRDGVEQFRLTGSTVGDKDTWGNLTHTPVFILLDVAIGGALPNALSPTWTPNDNTVGGLPSAMIVDYVAVYNSGVTTTTTTTTTRTTTTTTRTTTTTSKTTTAATGTPTNCASYAWVRTGDTCDSIVSRYAPSSGITKANLIKWNPSLGSDCSGILPSTNLCISLTTTTITTTTKTTTKTTTTTSPAGTPTDCNSVAYVRSTDTCDTIVSRYAASSGITKANLIKWNPSLGSTCSGIKGGTSLCISVPPGKTLPGTVSNCQSWAFSRSTDTCDAIVTRYAASSGVTKTNLIKWNPGVGSTCANIVGSIYLCVKA
ncbi:hypothetical protein H072_2419 [Dactylellina haptotyla CBS 200.50]|uniref:GH16 domain-containing protein n=1 Tax=Dactylellina haptotyla (strain CBS 200.50) TaxID=1284197 RepID=S8BVX3_DACHA|nr:hypothetical protein H072_2419 [Dactylellina haptotyla CBS 200.50]